MAATQQAELLEELEKKRQELDKTNKSLTAEVEALKRDAKLANIAMPAPAAANLLSVSSAEEIAARKKLEDQLLKAKRDLEEAREEVGRVAMAESSQKMSVHEKPCISERMTHPIFLFLLYRQLLDELNTLQQENGALRNQLRALKK